MSVDLENILIHSDCTIREVLEKLNIGAKGIVLVVDENRKLIGTVTDGDVRRALLKGFSIDDEINGFIHKNPIYVNIGASKEKIKEGI